MHSELVGFDVDGQHAAVARFTVVRRDADVAGVLPAARLRRRPLGRGRASRSRSTGGRRAASVSASVRTERRATTVELVGCTAPGQQQAPLTAIGDRRRSLVDSVTCLNDRSALLCAHPVPDEAQEHSTVTQASSEHEHHLADPGGLRQAPGRARATSRVPSASEIVARISAARDEGDLKENGGYHAAREEQGKTEARIRQLEDMLRRAEVGETPADDGVVEPGMKVTYKFVGDDDVGDLPARRPRDGRHHRDLQVYSPQSPLGSAIIGKQARARPSPTTRPERQDAQGRDRRRGALHRLSRRSTAATRAALGSLG